MALGLFFSQRFAYPADTKTYWTDANGDFLLTQFLQTSGYQNGNCQDVSDYLLILANSLGMNFTVAQFQSNPADAAGHFTTNPVCPIGSDPTNDLAYSSFTWAWHQVCLSQSGTVYDACAAQKYDLSGNAYRNPPFNWPLDGFWQTPPWGLVATPAPAAPQLQLGPYVPGIQ